MAEFVSLPRVTVVRRCDDFGSHVEPPYSDMPDRDHRMAWLIAVAREDTGLDVGLEKVIDGKEVYYNYRVPRVTGGGFRDEAGLGKFLNGFTVGAQAARDQLSRAAKTGPRLTITGYGDDQKIEYHP